MRPHRSRGTTPHASPKAVGEPPANQLVGLAVECVHIERGDGAEHPEPGARHAVQDEIADQV
jgi:hypothetical protein